MEKIIIIIIKEIPFMLMDFFFHFFSKMCNYGGFKIMIIKKEISFMLMDFLSFFFFSF